MTTNINFVEAKIAFIREFMNSTRPASELEEFIKAFDTCSIDITTHEPVNVTLPEAEHTDEEPAARLQKRIKAKKSPVIHSGNRPNVHPRAKMVKVTFLDRVEYYGSITAAAASLHVTQAQVKYAIKHHKTINGQEVVLQDADSVWRSPVKERDE